MSVDLRWRPKTDKDGKIPFSVKKHYPGGQDHDQTAHGNWSPGSKPLVIDPNPAAASSMEGLTPDTIRAIFESEVVHGDRVFTVEIDTFDLKGGEDGYVRVKGNITTDDNKYVGRFVRTVMLDKSICYNNEFFIEDTYQGHGLGFAILENWESEMRDYGIKEMRISAAGVGRYAWAKYGYEWVREADRWSGREAMRRVREIIDMYDDGSPAEWEIRDGEVVPPDPDSYEELRQLLDDYDSGTEVHPVDLAYVGAGSDRLGRHILLTGSGWEGRKEL